MLIKKYVLGITIDNCSTRFSINCSNSDAKIVIQNLFLKAFKFLSQTNLKKKTKNSVSLHDSIFIKFFNFNKLGLNILNKLSHIVFNN